MTRITTIATVGVAVLLMLTAALVYLGPRMGYRADTVISGSMQPTIGIGTMVVAQRCDPVTLQTGDIITFKPTSVGENNICHRIVEVQKSAPLTFKTKGDAQVAVDPWTLPAANVLGKVDFTFPAVGYVIGFLRTTVGLAAALVFPALVIIGFIFKALWKELVTYIRSSASKAG